LFLFPSCSSFTDRTRLRVEGNWSACADDCHPFGNCQNGPIGRR
jgi:hypothetical protein